MIRLMVPEDAARAAEIEAVSICPPWKEQDFLDTLQQDSLMLVAEENGRTAGYVVMYHSFEEGEITNVAVDPKMRGRHLAWQLMRETGERARTMGVERIVLEVRASNTPAIGLYRKCGFTELGRRKNFYEQPREDALIMEWILC